MATYTYYTVDLPFTIGYNDACNYVATYLLHGVLWYLDLGFTQVSII